jgi:hypothetical protein
MMAVRRKVYPPPVRHLIAAISISGAFSDGPPKHEFLPNRRIHALIDPGLECR